MVFKTSVDPLLGSKTTHFIELDYITVLSQFTVTVTIAPYAACPLGDPLQIDDIRIQNRCFLGLWQQRHAFLQNLIGKAQNNIQNSHKLYGIVPADRTDPKYQSAVVQSPAGPTLVLVT